MRKIIFYNTFFDQMPSLANVGQAWRPIFSFDRLEFHHAAAVIFHVPDLVFGTPNVQDILTLEKPQGQLWVAWCMESSVNYPILKDPHFRQKMDLFMTPQRDADIWAPYLPSRSTWKHALTAPLQPKTKTAPVVMFQSAQANKSGRLQFATEMMKHVPVDSYGEILRNCELPTQDNGRNTKLNFVAKYKFCLALENSIENDYVTEKFFDPLLVGTVPVYRGAPNVARFAPGRQCFIDANSFTNERELADYLLHLDRDDAAYADFLTWRHNPLLQEFENLLDAAQEDPLERLARRIVERVA